MTPQILLDALRHAFLTMDVMSLLIFDECHRACGNHPYSQIMKVMGFEDIFFLI
jgi:endoribonuclease Dicer